MSPRFPAEIYPSGDSAHPFWVAIKAEIRARLAIAECSHLLKQAQRVDLILESTDGTKYVLAKVRDSLAFYVGDEENFDSEVAATRKNKKLMEFLDERGSKARTETETSLAEVKKQLGD